jgi:hypothetical protein
MLAAGLIFGASPHDARGQEQDASIILETNATDCDTGLQLFFTGDAWKRFIVEDPDGGRMLDVTPMGPLRRLGLIEQFNETNEPVMEELVSAFPELECAEPESTL